MRENRECGYNGACSFFFSIDIGFLQDALCGCEGLAVVGVLVVLVVGRGVALAGRGVALAGRGVALAGRRVVVVDLGVEQRTGAEEVVEVRIRHDQSVRTGVLVAKGIGGGNVHCIEVTLFFSSCFTFFD